MDVKDQLSEQGFLFIPKWKTEKTIYELAKGFGEVLKISDYLNHSMIQDVQIIRPKEKGNSSEKQYSGKFGLNTFPLHTDLAHWTHPPKFMMLRCIKGAERVATRILTLDTVWDKLEMNGIRRAVVKSRDKQSCVLPLLFKVNDKYCIRWDSYFLEPMNENARKIRKVMLSETVWDLATDIRLVDCGDTLILNNHSTFHARSNVPVECTGRVIERVYFN